jgi:hypothetical protein
MSMTLIMATGELLVPFCGAPVHDHSEKAVAVPPKRFCSVRKRSSTRFLRPSHIRIAL